MLFRRSRPPQQPPATGSRIRLARFIMPCFFAASVALWLTAPDAFMSQITPIVGGLAVLCAGLNLGRVLLRILRFSYRHRSRLGDAAANRLTRLRRSVYSMMGVLVVTAAMAAGFYYLSAQLLGPGRPVGESRILWMLTVGGLVLALVFGELVTALVEVVDEAMADAEERRGNSV